MALARYAMFSGYFVASFSSRPNYFALDWLHTRFNCSKDAVFLIDCQWDLPVVQLWQPVPTITTDLWNWAQITSQQSDTSTNTANCTTWHQTMGLVMLITWDHPQCTTLSGFDTASEILGVFSVILIAKALPDWMKIKINSIIVLVSNYSDWRFQVNCSHAAWSDVAWSDTFIQKSSLPCIKW